jgi:hypothetical protein
MIHAPIGRFFDRRRIFKENYFRLELSENTIGNPSMLIQFNFYNVKMLYLPIWTFQTRTSLYRYYL